MTVSAFCMCCGYYNTYKMLKWIALGIVVFSIVVYYIVGGNAMSCLMVSSSLLTYAIIKRGATGEQSYKVLQWY